MRFALRTAGGQRGSPVLLFSFANLSNFCFSIASSRWGNHLITESRHCATYWYEKALPPQHSQSAFPILQQNSFSALEQVSHVSSLERFDAMCASRNAHYKHQNLRVVYNWFPRLRISLVHLLVKSRLYHDSILHCTSTTELTLSAPLAARSYNLPKIAVAPRAATG